MGPRAEFTAQTSTPFKAQTTTPFKRKPISPIKRDHKKKQVQATELDQATVGLNPSGFFQVQVDPGHCQMISEGCGITLANVEKALQADNEARMVQDDTIPTTNQSEDFDWEHEARFEPDPEDDMEDLDLTDLEADLEMEEDS